MNGPGYIQCIYPVRDNNKHVQRGPLQMNVCRYARTHTHTLTQLRLLTRTTGANKQQLWFASQPNTSHRQMQAICTTRCFSLSLTRSTVSDCSIQQVLTVLPHSDITEPTVCFPTENHPYDCPPQSYSPNAP